MQEETKKALASKEQEYEYVCNIVTQLTRMELLYNEPDLHDPKDLSAIQNAKVSWEKRQKTVEQQLDLIRSQMTPEIIGDEVLDLSSSVQKSLEDYEDTTNKVFHEIENISKNEWLDFIASAQKSFKSSIIKENVFVDDDVINNTKGYMLGPVGIFNNKGVQATDHHSFNSLDELKTWVEEKSQKHDMVIYMTYENNNKYHWRGALV
jgi:hypothetical protein